MPGAPAGGTVRVMTYNVHGCIGRDGRLSPERVAGVIAGGRPDVVALQELDVGRRRSGSRDQAREIAAALDMAFHFHPALREEEEHYGDAVLSRLPMRLVRAGALPAGPPRRSEPRGALWVEVDAGGGPLQVVTTHLGLSPRERARQVEALLGPEWLGLATQRGPAVLCGDLNVVSWSRAYRRFAARLRDAVRQPPARPRPTFPSRFPLLRIDHVFATADAEVVRADVPRTPQAVAASDHLPLVVEFRLAGAPRAR
jgi:endonuclease/exonuclease/phosphatase family metal-dependent hydrolase